MAGTKISELPVATTLTGAELVPVVQSGATKQTTLAQMPYVPDGTGAVTTTVQAKLRETVSVKDFGAVGDGVTDDTAAIQAALASGAKKIVVTADTPTPLLTAMITVGAGQVLELECGGKNAVTLPPIHFIKAASMTTAAIKILSRGRVKGGGLRCISGNTGDGVWLAGNNAQLFDFAVDGAGNDGVRVGVDGTPFVNCNSNYLEHVISTNNGRHGFYLHDGTTQNQIAGAADANAGVMLNCEAAYNGGDGIKLGNAWWWSVISALTEVNTGWGLNLSSTVVPPSTVAECRYANIFGGDFNESNTAGSANIAGYGATVFMASLNQVLNVTGTLSNVFGAGADSFITGLKIGDRAIQASNGNQLLNFDGTNNALTYHPNLTTTTLGTTSARWAASYETLSDVTTSHAVTFQSPRGSLGTASSPNVKNVLNMLTGTSSSVPGNSASGIQAVNELLDNSNVYLRFYTTAAGVGTSSKIEIGPTGVIRPLNDNTQSLGTTSTRWSVVYAGTGTINTSDARQKQQIRSLTDAEHAVAVRLKSLVRAFKFNDAVEQKGDGARIHFGVIAQDVKAAFEIEGLVAENYAIFCYDEWADQWETHSTIETVVNENGDTVEVEKTSDPVLVRASGNRYGIRYEELLAFIISAL